jgi:hypothetical protein
LTTYNSKVHIVKGNDAIAPAISELLGTPVSSEQVESIKTLLFGEETQLRTRNNRPAVYFNQRLRVEDFETFEQPIGETADIVLRQKKRTGPNND